MEGQAPEGLTAQAWKKPVVFLFTILLPRTQSYACTYLSERLEMQSTVYPGRRGHRFGDQLAVFAPLLNLQSSSHISFMYVGRVVSILILAHLFRG